MKRLTAILLAAMLLLSGTALANLGYLGHSYALDYFVHLPVVTYGRGSLVFQSEPYGSFMPKYSYSDGDWIYVNHFFRDGNYALAYDFEDDIYGYVDASYIDWTYSDEDECYCGDDVGVDSSRDLNLFGYRMVVTGGRGSLVFQREPRGSFMSNYRFDDGDLIYVNLYYREGSYAIAYDPSTGVFGYVDASYINW